MPRSLRCSILIHFACCLPALVHADGEWPGWRGPQHNGHTKEMAEASLKWGLDQGYQV